MKKIYDLLTIELIALQNADVLTESGFNGDEQPVDPPFPANFSEE